MGTSTDAHCLACGYDALLMIGAGMRNHDTFAAWPVRCNQCRSVTTANFKRTPLVCSQCLSTDVVPFTDPEEWKGEGSIIVKWGQLTLTDGRYRCPKCSKFEMRFGTDAKGRGLRRWD